MKNSKSSKSWYSTRIWYKDFIELDRCFSYVIWNFDPLAYWPKEQMETYMPDIPGKLYSNYSFFFNKLWVHVTVASVMPINSTISVTCIQINTIHFTLDVVFGASNMHDKITLLACYASKLHCLLVYLSILMSMLFPNMTKALHMHYPENK